MSYLAYYEIQGSKIGIGGGCFKRMLRCLQLVFVVVCIFGVFIVAHIFSEADRKYFNANVEILLTVLDNSNYYPEYPVPYTRLRKHMP